MQEHDGRATPHVGGRTRTGTSTCTSTCIRVWIGLLRREIQVELEGADAVSLVLLSAGEIPRELEGSYYRTGADRQFPTLENDIILNGDGLASMFRFENGHVSFRSRYVQTERLKRERQTGLSAFVRAPGP